MSAKRRLIGALDNLGSNPDDVAALLESGSWTGTPYDPDSCPVARYLTAMVPDGHGVSVRRNYAVVDSPDGGGEVEVGLPRPVVEFVEAFDLGAYPGLIATATDDNGDVIDDLDR